MNKIEIVKETDTTAIEGTVLGQRVSAPINYNPDILVRVPRSENRIQYGITDSDFHPAGSKDDWYCYECSTLTDTGIPVYFSAILSYPASSKYIVESKSLKLYLNSFNMEKMGLTPEYAIKNYCNKVKKDLSSLLEVDPDFDYNLSPNLLSFEVAGPYNFTSLDKFSRIEDILSLKDIYINDYNESPELLKHGTRYDEKSFGIKFNGFRSNCKVTHQPDYATVYIKYKGEVSLDMASLYQYLSSFRNESHFHEECCEAIYKRIMSKFSPEKLFVRCNYTRRGGIDINPTRSNYSHGYDLSRTEYQ